MSDVSRTFHVPSDLSSDQVKQLEESFRSLTVRQQQLAAEHPSVIAAGVVRRVENAFELVYDVEGARSLADVLATEHTDVETVLRWGARLCEVLAGTAIHGGICADSVWVTAEDDIRVLDFGVAECFNQTLSPSDEAWVTQVAAYVAPEVWTAPSRLSQQSDIFAVGVLLYQLATHQHPFAADPTDPENCKFQILIEVPVPAAKRSPEIDEALSDIIAKAVRTEVEQRYQSFSEMLAAIESHGRRSAPADEDSTVTEEGRDEDEIARRRYLDEQARLKKERADARQRQEQRRRSLQGIKAVIRRHALAFGCAAFGFAVVVASATVLILRSSNARAIEDHLDSLVETVNQRIAQADADGLARRLGVAEPPRRFARAVAFLSADASQMRFAIEEPTFSNVWNTTGEADWSFGDKSGSLRFGLDGSGDSSARVQGLEVLPAALTEAADTLALARLDPKVRALMTKIQAIFDDAETLARAEVRLAELMFDSRDRHDSVKQHLLGYLSYQAGRKILEPGTFAPVHGEDAVRFEAALTDLDGQEILETPPEVVLHFDCAAKVSDCRLDQISVEPIDEPRPHRTWCMETVVAGLRQAFAGGDVEELVRIAKEADTGSVAKTIEWAGRCRSAALTFRPINFDAARVQAVIEYVPGILSDSPFQTGPLSFEFDPLKGWDIQAGTRNEWPVSPPPLLRQARGRQLVERLQRALGEGDASGYRRIFEGTSRGELAVAEMLSRMRDDGVKFKITPLEDENSESLLQIQVESISKEGVGTDAYRSKLFGFELENDILRWDGRTDPLWIIEGLAYQNFAGRLQRSTWENYLEIKRDFEQTDLAEMSTGERRKLISWFDALDSARARFSAESDEFFAGFPKRVRLTESSAEAPMLFRLITSSGPPQYLTYVQEREVRVSDMARHWRRADQPWNMWRSAVGDPPANQVVGLTLAEAREIARDLGCEIPTRRDWVEAARQFGESSDRTSEFAFYGGVWEFCRDGEPGSPPLVVGGSWLDYDPELADAGVSLPQPGTDLVARQSRFGTIGFRLFKRVELADDMIDFSVAVQPDSAPPRP